MLQKYFFLLFLSLFSFGYSQELPPIIKFSSNNYQGGNQNWMITQDHENMLYVANTEGLLQYNGSSWTLYPSPNETIIRSAKYVNGKIYTGCYMEFGFWTKTKNGQLQYTSLSKNVSKNIIDDEQFWNIIDYDHYVIFQSLNQIFIYDTKANKFSIIKPNGAILNAFKVGNSIFYQVYSEGLFEIENGRGKLFSNQEVLKNNKIINIFPGKNGLLLQTQFQGFYDLEFGELKKWNIPADNFLSNTSIYSSQKLRDGGFALGSVSNGIFILNANGSVRYHITQNKGLSNNTALSVFEDHEKNIWVGLDNGINCINLDSPVRTFADDTGFLGTVYTSILHNNLLYVGTNQGLFYKKFNSDESFTFINQTKGQVWSLFSYGGTLFCGHDSGTFIVKGNSVSQIFNTSGTWKFEQVEGNSQILLQGNYHGISVLQKVKDQWIFRNKIEGFDYSSKYFELNSKSEIYVSHEYKGVFRLKPDAGFYKTNGFETLNKIKKGKNAGLVKYNGAIYYAFKGGIFKLTEKTKTFERDKDLSRIFERDVYTSGKMMADNANRLWLFSKNYINYFSSGKMNNSLKHNIIPIPSSLTNSMLGYENITQISNTLYLVGTTDGYYTIDINDWKFHEYKAFLTAINVSKPNENGRFASLQNGTEFKHFENNITFFLTVPEFNKYVIPEYQYRLKGFNDQWSDWNLEPNITLKNLPPGKYLFEAKAKIGKQFSENLISYQFVILKPWYRTNLAVVIYLIIMLALAYFINKAYKNYFEKQQAKLIEENKRLLEIKELASEQELMKIRNHQLEQEFESKNRELAASTMSLIKKNELLSLIKDDLKKSEGDRNIKSVISTINKNISEEDTWNVFKDAFNNADKDFLKKIKQLHPSLTPNDLRLCAYLRLNLSSKEIAPLLNISVRSVEIKRYRLRKKMDLPHEESLVEYILSV